MPFDISRLPESPKYHCVGFDRNVCHFVEMDREAFRRSIFLDRRVQPADPFVHGVARPAVDRAFDGRTAFPSGWIFHVAHCGSTLLANLLDQPDVSLVLREPPTLRQLGIERASSGAEDFQAGLRLARALTTRRFNADEQAVIKANVPVNFILPDLQGLISGEPAIALYLDWQDYLVAILRSEGHRQWVVRITQQLGPLISARLDEPIPDTLAGRAAALWLAQMVIFAELLNANPAAAALNANDLFARPLDVAKQCATHMGLVNFDPVRNAPLIRQYSKNPKQAFTNEERQKRFLDDQTRLAGELDIAERWLGNAKHGGVLSQPFGRIIV